VNGQCFFGSAGRTPRLGPSEVQARTPRRKTQPLMVEAQGSIGQRIDGNVGSFATDSTVDESPEVGAFENELEDDACVGIWRQDRRLMTRGHRSR